MKEQTLVIDTFVPALRTLAGVLDKGAAHAREKGSDPEAMLKERLAPDMFPSEFADPGCVLSRQGCDGPRDRTGTAEDRS